MRRVVYDRVGRAHPIPHLETEDEREIRLAAEGREEFYPKEDEGEESENVDEDLEEPTPLIEVLHSESSRLHQRRHLALKQKKSEAPLTAKEITDRRGKRAVNLRTARKSRRRDAQD